METIWLNPWMQALYGWLTYQLWLVFFKHWNMIDKNKNGFIESDELKAYFWKYFRTILFSAWCIPLGVWYIEPLWGVFFDMPFFEYSYVVAGLASIGLQMMLNKNDAFK